MQETKSSWHLQLGHAAPDLGKTFPICQASAVASTPFPSEHLDAFWAVSGTRQHDNTPLWAHSVRPICQMKLKNGWLSLDRQAVSRARPCADWELACER